MGCPVVRSPNHAAGRCLVSAPTGARRNQSTKDVADNQFGSGQPNPSIAHALGLRLRARSRALRASPEFPGLASTVATETSPQPETPAQCDARNAGLHGRDLPRPAAQATEGLALGWLRRHWGIIPEGPSAAAGPGGSPLPPSPRDPNATSHGEAPGGGYSPIPPRRPLSARHTQVKQRRNAEEVERRARDVLGNAGLYATRAPPLVCATRRSEEDARRARPHTVRAASRDHHK